ncbi:MAG: hypothetical protein K2X09_02955 [Rickettsiales bacterium]|nr:hypothetical protein [Rickettsiales bacterium]
MKVTSHTTLIVGKAGKSEQVPPGTPVDIEDEEARDLIARGIAVRVSKAESKPAEKETKDPQGGKQPPADPEAGKQP